MTNHTILVLGLLLSACATSFKPAYFYNEVLIVNKSRQLVHDVTIFSSETGRTFSCGNIAPLGICSNKFGKRRYERIPIRIAWVFGGNALQTSEFVLEVPATMQAPFPLRGVLEISPRGSISAYCQHDSPVKGVDE